MWCNVFMLLYCKVERGCKVTGLHVDGYGLQGATKRFSQFPEGALDIDPGLEEEVPPFRKEGSYTLHSPRKKPLGFLRSQPPTKYVT